MPKNFVCNRCKESFRDNHDLQKHRNRKKPCLAAEEPVVELPKWQCEPCNTSFSSRGNLKAHLKTKLHERMTASNNSNVDVDNTPIDSSDDGQTSHDAVTSIETPPHPNNEAHDVAGPSDSSPEPSLATPLPINEVHDAAGPSTSTPDDQAVDFALPTIDTSKIRKTSENPPRVAVFDLIAVITGLNVQAIPL